ncbi:hypothetical protein JCM8097_001040 [Rhodosporidiobolus ruineniae]
MPGHNQDRLSSLPRDVLALIFSYTDKPARLRPLSKTLWPVQQAALYQHARFRTVATFAKFVKTVLEHPDHLGKLVEGLVVYNEWKKWDSIAHPVKIEREPDANCPSTTTLRQLFRALVNLKSLSVTGSSRIAEAALSPVGADQRFKQLESLDLHSSVSGWQDPTYVAHFVGIEHWQQLRVFNYITEARVQPGGGLIPVPPPEPCPSFPHVKALTVHAPLGGTWKTLDLFKLFSGLTHLAVHASADGSTSFGVELLKTLPNRSALVALDLVRTDGQHPADIAPVLPDLVNLTSLSVGGEGMIVKKKFYEAIAKLTSLRELSFSIGCKGVATAPLTKVISGADKHPSLETLVLDHIRDCAHGGYFPEWTSRFKPKGLEKFLKVADREDVEVVGDALWALDHDEGGPIDDIIDDMQAYKQRYRDFAINTENLLESMGLPGI